MTLSTIQPMGKKPLTAPSTAARSAIPAGIVNRKIATSSATTSAITAARCAFTLPDAMRTRSETTGRAAAMVERAELPNGS